MLSELDNFLFKFFSKEVVDFNSLSEDDKRLIFEVALSYPDLFKLITPFINANYFYDEYNGRGDLSYYPHYFLINADNAKWFVENCVNLRESFFIYSDWFSDDEGNLRARASTVPASLKNQHYKLLEEESENTLSFMEIQLIIENVVNASKNIGFAPRSTEGLSEYVNDLTHLTQAEKKELITLINSI